MDDIINVSDGKVQVIFERTYDNQVFRDALWFTEQEYADTTSEQITTMQDQRLNNWIAIINAPPTEE
jgi:hypothetical protein